MESVQNTDASPEKLPLLSVVFSLRNEEDVLHELFSRLYKTLDQLKLRYELVFVNDDSTDRTLEILKEHAAKDPRVKIINTSRRFGVIRCFLAGFRYARGDALVYMDADLQDPPELIATLVEKWREGADVVHTTRTKRLGESPMKMWLTRQAYRIINFVADIKIPIDTGNFKLLTRRVVEQILSIGEQEPFLRGLVVWVGFKQVYVPYERQPRYSGETHYPLFGSINPTRSFVTGVISFSSAPLYFALVMGLMVSAGSFFYLVFVVVTRLLYGWHQPGWPAMMVTMLFLGGTILFTIGVLGLYVGKIYNHIKGRPLVVIESTVGVEDGFRIEPRPGP
ncbi:MAG: glycosyltransferase family 2 protein [Magnetococcales bacterium]|nr:glycosyltransferase family 2 protein [Magnetococcales bacterium]MBF0321407.1 glycosyltransferase family 2 protein [Magnetococcales bacterium]